MQVPTTESMRVPTGEAMQVSNRSMLGSALTAALMPAALMALWTRRMLYFLLS